MSAMIDGFDPAPVIALGEMIRQRKAAGMSFEAVLASLTADGYTITPAFFEQVGWLYGVGRPDRSYVDHNGLDQPEPPQDPAWIERFIPSG